jgi:RNA polymerase sigma factor (sigma-70 family)
VIPDAELLATWRGGDAAAGATLFERHFDALYRFFRNKVGDGIDDLIQETFLACIEGPAFRGESSFRTYLFAIARNALHAHVRKLGRARAEVDVGDVSVADLGTSPSGVVARRREERLLLEALRGLPMDMQIALELFYWEDLAGPDLATVLAVPEGTVRSRLRRAREALEHKLAELADDPEVLSSTTTDLEDWAKRVRDRVHPLPAA